VLAAQNRLSDTLSAAVSCLQYYKKPEYKSEDKYDSRDSYKEDDKYEVEEVSCVMACLLSQCWSGWPK
jgi:hypothetical protein